MVYVILLSYKCYIIYVSALDIFWSELLLIVLGLVFVGKIHSDIYQDIIKKVSPSRYGSVVKSVSPFTEGSQVWFWSGAHALVAGWITDHGQGRHMQQVINSYVSLTSLFLSTPSHPFFLKINGKKKYP